MLLDIQFDPSSMASIARLLSFDLMLEEEMAPSMEEAGQIVTEAAQANTWTAFQNPIGKLAGSIEPVMVSPMEVGISVGVPYGFRREYGFVGMTDSLGRVGTDPAEPYAGPALDANADKVMELMDLAIERTWIRVGGV